MTETNKTDGAAIPQQAPAPETGGDDRDVLLRVEGLTKHFPIKKGILQRQVGAVKAVDGIDFEVRKGETLGVVGESGCGKSTMGRVITRLQDPTGGRITFDGQDITRLGTGRMRPLRRDIQMIFQDPYGSLNPRHTIGSIVSAPFRLQGVEPEGGVKKEVQRLLELVGLSPEHYNRYPHEFSGGQRQRIGIARALALKPKLVVADEPVSALDVSIQAQVVNLMDDLQEELGLTYVIIAHDLSVVRHVSDRIAVMYLGKMVEIADRTSLYEAPMHPYTKALMSAVPVPDPKRRGAKSERILLRGDVPSPISPPSGCRFHTRCWKATEICRTTEPLLLELRPGQRVACHHPENFADQAPQDTVLLTAAKEASELVPDAVLEESAETSAAVAAEVAETAATKEPEAEKPSVTKVEKSEVEKVETTERPSVPKVEETEAEKVEGERTETAEKPSVTKAEETKAETAEAAGAEKVEKTEAEAADKPSVTKVEKSEVEKVETTERPSVPKVEETEAEKVEGERTETAEKPSVTKAEETKAETAEAAGAEKVEKTEAEAADKPSVSKAEETKVETTGTDKAETAEAAGTEKAENTEAEKVEKVEKTAKPGTEKAADEK